MWPLPPPIVDTKRQYIRYVRSGGRLRVGGCMGELVEDETAIDEPLYGRHRGLDVDIDRILSWFQWCQREHSDNCSAAFLKTTQRPVPTLMIDVVDKCLRPADTGVKYTALSYVWGRNNEPQTRESTLQEFSEVGAFDRVNLPRTIEDAIVVTIALGFRNLWIDSLCIVQDREKEKLDLINAMDSIYSQAALTLVAATGDTAHSGLSGWSRESREEVQELTATVASDLTIGVSPPCGHLIETCDWVQRGWTYQEGVLSNRCLIFLEGQIYFICQKNLWREDLV
ncbi:heterokaryon incompatibility protein-domain-containing protein [Daldinia decipiens]|uniref:heterokaryon incompatibility protein-domain-containing protein n=1 Tax=Daldinia decipiens TaxID=326647 RepID=UPI0020C56D49|nr:heterokaryon incompatibility protein-domain-containing protein [Daldinia decipiens]KAI1653072.1 heterokaryon incompatibility protein-domain-containing protein [Daldinia decipiens]